MVSHTMLTIKIIKTTQCPPFLGGDINFDPGASLCNFNNFKHPFGTSLVLVFEFILIYGFYCNYDKYFEWEKVRHRCRATRGLKACSLILKKGAPQYEFSCNQHRQISTEPRDSLLALHLTLALLTYRPFIAKYLFSLARVFEF
jgi:hypothetical protein